MKSASENESQIAVSLAGMHNDEIFSWWNLSRKECRNRLDLFISWYNEQKNHCIGVDLVDKEGFLSIPSAFIPALDWTTAAKPPRSGVSIS